MIGRLEIDLDALRENARALRALVEPAGAAFVVKSNAYGHGLVDVARAVAPLTDRLCVYGIEEALELRAAGIRNHLLVMGPVESAHLHEAIQRNIEIALWDNGAYVRAVVYAARAANKRARIHAKINTGVARLGLDPEQARTTIPAYLAEPELQLDGVFSHLAAAEELDSPFTDTQLARFQRMYSGIEPALKAAGVRPQRHVAASAAAMLWPQTRLDFARIGIALYGLWPSPQTRTAMNAHALQLRPALRYTTQLVAVREVQAGTPIGYGASYHAPRDTRIGVIPLGYADGIPRALSNTGSFLVNGVRAPIAGRICMNMAMLDLAGVNGARPGTEVTLIGADGAECISADDWATWAGTINYEIVARLPGHLPRAFRSTD